MPDPPKITIPIPVKGDTQSVHETLMNMKQAVEILLGTRGGQPVTRTFVQKDQPTAHNVGDLWIVEGTGKTAYWDGQRWLNAVT